MLPWICTRAGQCRLYQQQTWNYLRTEIFCTVFLLLVVFLQSALTFSFAEHCTPWEGGVASPQVTAFLFSFALFSSAPPWQHHATIQECFLLSSPLFHPFWIRFSLLLYLFFFQACKHHSKQPFYSDGLESFLCTSKKVRKILQKEKRREKNPPFIRKFLGLLPCFPNITLLQR